MSDFAELPVDSIVPSPHQPRGSFAEEELQQLADSIQAVGLIHPITVRRCGDGFELIAGERRLRAARLAGLERIPAIIESVSRGRAACMALIENVQRANLNPVEEALAYQRLQKEFGLTQRELAERVGKSRSTIANVLRVLQLPEVMQASLRRGEMTLGHAKAILAQPTPAAQMALFSTVTARGWSVRQAEAAHPGRRRPPCGDAVPPEVQKCLRELSLHLGVPVSWQGGELRLGAPTEADLFHLANLFQVMEVL